MVKADATARRPTVVISADRSAGPAGDDRIAVVLADGMLREPVVIRWRLDHIHAPCVIAADGGARHAEPLGLEPDIVVGDLDSIGSDHVGRLTDAGADFRVSPVEKSETDLELALLHAVGLGISRIVVIAALGGRLDMALSNVLLLTHEALIGRSVEIWNGWESAWLVRPPGGLLQPSAIEGAPWVCGIGDRLSLIPLAGDALGVTTQGLQYPLVRELLRFGPARGVSNVVVSNAPSIEADSGVLLAVHAPSEERQRQMSEGLSELSERDS